MKTICCLLTLLLFFLHPCISHSQSCNNWLKIPSAPGYAGFGDLDVPGNKITVEAMFNRTLPWTGSDLYQGDLVSKHTGPNDCNYLLRPGSAEITTTAGYFKTPTICEIQLNKTYHVAMVYDGATLKFYRNGFLMSQIAATGNLYQNDLETRIGLFTQQALTQENLLGYINEVRIWNVSRTQSEIRSTMVQPLANPASVPGLVAYYTFDNLVNKQGNAAWNGTLGGSATLNEYNPNCPPVIDSCPVNCPPAPYYDFGYQQSLCAPKTVQFNTAVYGVPSYQWTFGDGQTAGSNPAPSVGYAAYGTYPVKLVVQYAAGCFTTVSKDITVAATYDPAMVLNGDTAICAGDSVRISTVSNTLNYCWQTSNGQPVPASLSSYVKPPVPTTYYLNVEQSGANLVSNSNFSGGNTGFTSGYSSAATNTTEGQYWVGTSPRNWNPSMSACTDHTGGTGNMMMVNGSPAPGVKIWSQTVPVTPNTNYAFSTWIQSLYPQNPANLKFSINNITIGDNILAGQPCTWNRFSTTWNSGATTSAVITIVNNNTIVQGNDFALDDIFFGPIVVKTDSFRVTMAARPTLSAGKDTAICEGLSVQLGATVSGGTITWSPAAGLSNTTIANPVATPAATTRYIAEARNGQCAVRDSLAVTVKPLPRVSLGRDTSFCTGDSLVLNAGNPGSVFRWQDGSAAQTFTARDTGLYSVNVATNGCSAAGTIHLSYYPQPQFSIMGDTAVCRGASLPIRTVSAGILRYSWAPATGLSDPAAGEPLATVAGTTRYIATARNTAGCAVRDTITITAVLPPAVSLGADTAICAGTTLVLDAGNSGATYAWDDGTTTPARSITGPGIYSVVVSGNGCSAADTITVSMAPAPNFTLTPLAATVCEGEGQVLSAGGGDRYQWLHNGAPLADAGPVIRVSPSAASTYSVVITANRCGDTDTLSSVVSVKPLPVLTLNKSNDVSCVTPQARVSASGGVQYTWLPAVNISSTTVASPTVYPSADTWYTVVARGVNGCEATDSIKVLHIPGPGSTFYIPNAFTPNGDGKNDCFGVRYWGEVEHLELAIFNRWGERVFYTTNIRDCWNGTYNGVLQPGGVYVYLVKVKSACGNADKKGTITLVR